MKQCRKVWLMIALCLAVLASQAIAVSAEETYPFTYEVLENGTARITAFLDKWDEEYTVIHVPHEIDGYTVSVIGECAFLRTFCAEEIYLPEGIQVIEASAFQESTMQIVHLPSTLQTVDNQAFFHCTELSKVVVPASVTTIGEKAFGYAWYVDPEEPVVPGIPKVIPEFTMVVCDESDALSYAQTNQIAYQLLSSFETGDMDLSGNLNIADAFVLYKMSAGVAAPKWYQQELVDLDENGRLDISDAYTLYVMVSGENSYVYQ